MKRNVYVVMGATGSGKSTIGIALARALGVDFIEGDDYHPAENVRLMTAGIPLSDDDRAGWLRSLASRILDAKDSGVGLVVACSALKRSYRDVFRAAAPDLQFIFLKGMREVIADRIAARHEHFMPASLLDSQLATLEVPGGDEHAWVCDISEPPQEIVKDLVTRASA